MFRLGYNTNGLAHHRPVDALRLLAELGYEAVALTPDVGPLDPCAPDPVAVGDVRRCADELGLELTLETGARFVLDPRRKHYPGLLEDEAAARQRRIDLLRRFVDLARELGAGLVSLWAGRAPGGETAGRVGPAGERLWERLCEGLRPVVDHARGAGVRLAFEPEPGMFVERPAEYDELVRRLGAAGGELGLCLDVGHLLVTGDRPEAEAIRRWAPRLVHVHLDDVAGGVHEHRMLGTGDLDLEGTLEALLDVGYDGVAAVELSRDSHRGAEAAERALACLRSALIALS